MKIGLALSGGAARGIAHIGVLKYLEERGVKPCCIAGTSAGSIVGAFYCSGMTLAEIAESVSSMSWRKMFKLAVPRRGLIRSSRLLKIIRENIGEVSFEEMKIPLVINAVDLLSGEEVVITGGPVAEAVQASCAIPGIFTPVRMNNRLLVDGGLLDNVPVSLMQNRDIDYSIAVDVGAQEPMQKEPETIFEILAQSYYIIRRHRNLPAYRFADALVEPDLGEFSFWDSSRAELMIERGYLAAKEVLAGVNFDKKTNRLSRWLKRQRKHKG